jgi:PilZ domain-containing protein
MMTIGVNRLEKRIPMAIAVHISGHGRAPGVETTFTENVSSRGARVVSTRRWRPNEMLEIASLPGDFRAKARVAYCQSQSEGFVIGLEFLEPSGRWVINAPAVSGKPLQG